jgi:plastocyanin
MSRRLALLLATAALVGAALAPAAAHAANPTLTGTVGPGFTITLKGPNATVKTLKAGTYKIVIHDLADIHDFHLMGPGVDKKTSVSGKGTTTWTVKLKKGTYKYQCDPHASMMKGSFKVT